MRCDGDDPTANPGRMSLTITVPTSVPSLFQTSPPALPLAATRKSVPPTLMSPLGLEDWSPEWISFTRTVPTNVPSLFHSSLPFAKSPAAK
jgi:hypothetical protein